MRYVAKVLKMTLAEKFPDATDTEIYKASVFPPQPLGLSFASVVSVNPQTEIKGQINPVKIKTQEAKYSPCKLTLAYQQGSAGRWKGNWDMN